MNEQSTFLTKATDTLSGLWKPELSAMESKCTHSGNEKYLVKEHSMLATKSQKTKFACNW